MTDPIKPPAVAPHIEEAQDPTRLKTPPAENTVPPDRLFVPAPPEKIAPQAGDTHEAAEDPVELLAETGKELGPDGFSRRFHFWRNIVAAAVLLGATILIALAYHNGLFASPRAMRAFIAKHSTLAPLLFMAIQTSQVIFPVVPGGLTQVAGVLLFGPVWGFVYNYISICIGSIADFWIARSLGKDMVIAAGGRQLFDKYSHYLDDHNRFVKIFTVAIFLPFAPDDFLCMLAGITKMKFRTFLTILLIGKPFTILMYSMGMAKLMRHLFSFLPFFASP